MRVMVVEDKEEFALQAIEVVEGMGGQCAWMTNIDDALADIAEAEPPYQAIILDRMLNDGARDGLCMIESLERSGFMLPVIVASALKDPDHHLEGRAAGAVDYISKPYEARELEIKLRVHTKRTRFAVKRLELDVLKRAAYFAEEPVPLAPKCFDILSLLAFNVGQPVLREALHRAAWPDQATISRDRVDTAIKRLRKELSFFEVADAVELVERVGYRLNPAKL